MLLANIGVRVYLKHEHMTYSYENIHWCTKSIKNEQINDKKKSLIEMILNSNPYLLIANDDCYPKGY